MTTKQLETAYRLACERYAEHGVNVEAAVRKLAPVAISIHCWQGDDVRGFENSGAAVGGGLAVTGD
jgi:L-rhamnose isomerase